MAATQEATAANDDSSGLPFHVIIIGAGLAGLTTAYELLQRFSLSSLPASLPSPPRLRLTVLEARSRVGGRLLSLPGGLELGATWLWPQHRNVWRLCRMLHLSTVPDPSMGDAVRVVDGTSQLASRLCERLIREQQHSSVKVRLSTAASAVRWDEHAGAVSVELADGTTIEGQAVVVAIPPKLAMSRLSFQPALPSVVVNGLTRVTTWMASTSKVVATFASAIWLTRGLPSIDGGPHNTNAAVGEWHDVSGSSSTTVTSGAPLDSSAPTEASSTAAPMYALMGFAPPGLTAADVERQLQSSYGPHFQQPSAVHVLDWSSEPWTSASRMDGRGGHPHTTAQQRQPMWNGRLYFASTEMAEHDAGYMEGAIVRGKQVAQQISDWARMAE